MSRNKLRIWQNIHGAWEAIQFSTTSTLDSDVVYTATFCESAQYILVVGCSTGIKLIKDANIEKGHQDQKFVPEISDFKGGQLDVFDFTVTILKCFGPFASTPSSHQRKSQASQSDRAENLVLLLFQILAVTTNSKSRGPHGLRLKVPHAGNENKK